MSDLTRVDAFLLRIEREVRLLERVVPTNLSSERTRLRAACLAGQRLEPGWIYSPAPTMSEVRRGLEEAERRMGDDAVDRLYRERIRELDLEAALVENRGSREFQSLANQRYPAASDDATGLAESWAALPAEETPKATVSLRAAVEERVVALGLSVRIVERGDLAARAAVGEDVVFVRRGERVTAREAARIAAHEIEAHLLPRLAARREALGLFRVGTRGAGEDEEGRALLIEERGGFLSPGRRRELGLRHTAASCVRGGGSFHDVVEHLLSRGADEKDALRGAERAWRGGGLARESAYLPGFLRVKGALSRDPDLERGLERGRLSLDAAEVLRSLSV